MKSYEVTSTVAKIFGGVVELNNDQYKTRAHNLEKIGKGKYKVLSPVQFKRGEQFGYDGEMPKSLAVDLKESGASGSDPQPAADNPDPKDPGTGD